MRALVTGATGFVGSHLTELLLSKGASVAVIHRASSDLWRIRESLPRLTRIEGDLLETDAIKGQIADFAPDVLFHLAWHGTGNTYRNDRIQVEKNLQPTLDLVDLAAEAGCKTWIGLGSQAEYGPQSNVIREDAPVNPTTLYGATKLSTYLLAQHIAREVGMRFAWLRLFSCYGPKDNPDWMIPYLIEKLRRREKPSLTAGEQKWDYLYVKDAAEAICQVAANSDVSGVFNLGSGETRTIRWIVEYIRDLIDPSLPLGFGEIPYRPDQIMRLQANIGRLNDIGWHPSVRLEDGLRHTVEWHTSRGQE